MNEDKNLNERTEDHIPKSILEWREKHPRSLSEQDDRSWQEIMASLKKICDDIIDGESE